MKKSLTAGKFPESGFARAMKSFGKICPFCRAYHAREKDRD